MIRLLIADDEPFIRQGIRYTIPWEKYDIEVVAEASNGKTALKLALQLTPDIVIADISMPIMTGLELASKLSDYLPETKVIILTAHGTKDNFTNAFQSKVSRFVLKSADSSIILDNVLQVKCEIEKEQNLNQSYEQINAIYSENQQLIKSTLFYRFLCNQIPMESFPDKAIQVGIPLSGPYYTILLAKCVQDNNWNTIGAFQNAFHMYQPFAFYVRPHILLLLLNTDQNGIPDKILKKAHTELKPYIVGNQLAYMNEISGYEEFIICYKILEDGLNDCFWNQERPYILIPRNHTLRSDESIKTLHLEKAIIDAAVCGSTLQAETALTSFYSYCKSHSLVRSDFLESVKRILLSLISLYRPEQDIEVLVTSVCSLETPEEILAFLIGMLKPQSSSELQKPQITEALKYINENYYKDLKLEDVANQIFLSPSYLSRIFKTETGYSFTECLNRIRIEKAKELIATSDFKYYEIAEKVGYRDYKYFSAYFNKFCGCSAKEYKYRVNQNPSSHR